MADPHGLRVALTVEQVWQRTPGGSGTYVVELSRALSEQPGVDAVGIAAWHREPPPSAWPVTIPVRRAPLPRRALYDAWQQLHLPRAEHLVRGTDVVHATTWAIPPTRRPLVVTVHDLAFLHDRSHFTARGNAFFRRALDRVRDDAAAVVVPSQVTADECVAERIDAARITVVPHGARVTRPSAAALADWRRRHGVVRDYVLWCGTVEPRKNLPTLLAAYQQAALADLDLVLVGPQGWGRLPATGAELDHGRVHVLGSLDRPDLDAAYAGARAFCFPSIREGFGLPVLEAMHHGVPVVTSAGTACAEVAGDAALLVDALDVDALAEALVEATGARHDELAARSTQRAAAFSWERSAETTVSVYREVSGTH
ncbi:glycosyltransferase family 4 protein [Cellulomonas xylanilytica]|uniref:Glycosyl transferase n=1 Tax=Cellulomonas xylanilytica TaxID=233583 RepID=A0A510V6V0_9CELL|nr:glycosyltransferase family 1 protein [Cellulomonas xylanilytica]GEK21651.1 glycosyl transferase [Cellulomonas xylanilytica]